MPRVRTVLTQFQDLHVIKAGESLYCPATKVTWTRTARGVWTNGEGEYLHNRQLVAHFPLVLPSIFEMTEEEEKDQKNDEVSPRSSPS